MPASAHLDLGGGAGGGGRGRRRHEIEATTMVEHLGWMHRGAGAIGDSERERGPGLRRLREAGSGRRSPGSH
jgi:hypothetical protein